MYLIMLQCEGLEVENGITFSLGLWGLYNGLLGVRRLLCSEAGTHADV